jgi:hypothetical protein
MSTLDRAALRRALIGAAPWLTATEVGPRAVDAGNCDRCGRAPRLLPTCGPSGADAVCRDCARALGDGGWCDGHLEEGRAARRWASQLPDRWADAVTLWWVATGELKPDPSLIDLGDWDDEVHRALGR